MLGIAACPSEKIDPKPHFVIVQNNLFQLQKQNANYN